MGKKGQKNALEYSLWSEEDDAILKNLIEIEKLKFDEVAKRINRTRGAIIARVKLLGLSYHYAKGEKTEFTEDDINLIRSELEKDKMWKEIADLPEFKGRHSASSIMTFFSKNKEKYGLIKISKRMSKEVLNKCIDEYKTGKYSIQEVSRRNNVSFDALVQAIRKRKLTMTVEEMILKSGYVPGHPNLFITKELLKEEICSKGRTAIDLATELGVDDTVIHKRMSLFGLKYPKKENPLLSNKKYKLLVAYLGHPLTKIKGIDVAKVLPKKTLEDLWHQGKTLKEIGKIVGLGIWDIGEVIIRRSFKFHKIKTKPEHYEDSFWEYHYFKQGESLEDLSELTGFRIEYIRTYLRKKFPGKKPEMKGSAGERLVQGVLNSLNIKYKRQYYIPEGKIYNKRLYIDFCLKYNKKIFWIEYNGSQHYKVNLRVKNKKFLGDPECFKRGVYRDSVVRNYCKENSIILIEIPYTVRSTREITEILSEIILNDKTPEEIIDLSVFFSEIKESLSQIDKLGDYEEI